MLIDLNKRLDESELEYIGRLGKAKYDGLLDMTWQELSNIFNKNLRGSDNWYSESVYRKKFASLQKFQKEFGNKNVSYNEEMEELENLKKEIQKEKRKLFDQRREYNKILTAEARDEHLVDYMVEAANNLNDNYPLLDHYFSPTASGKEAIACFADWHYGMKTDNVWNKYDIEICKKRVSQCVYYMRKYLEQNNVSVCHVILLGDCCHGAIHSSCRIKSEEDTCDQIMEVSEIIAQAVYDLSSVVNKVFVYSCYGNHLRTIQKKEESIHTDNMEKIVPWWLKQRFKDNPKIEIVFSEYKEFTKFNVLGYNICAVHGDLFEFKNIGMVVNNLFSKLFGETIDYTISGDKHHLEEFEGYGIESVLVRSLCGTDDYANQKHLYGKAGQTLMIFNKEYGRECTYHIPLD